MGNRCTHGAWRQIPCLYGSPMSKFLIFVNCKVTILGRKFSVSSNLRDVAVLETCN